jgi:hypothetical protein
MSEPPSPPKLVYILLIVNFFGGFDGDVCHGELWTCNLNQKSDKTAGHNIVCF